MWLDNRHAKSVLFPEHSQHICVSVPSLAKLEIAPGGYSTLENLEQRVDATKAAMWMAWNLGCNVVSNRIGKIPPSDSPDFPNLVQALEDLGRHSSHVGAVFAARTGDDNGEELHELITTLSPGSLNIDFDPAELLINRLIAADKQFAMMAYPNRSHGIYEFENTSRHLRKLMTEYFLQWLPAGPAD